MPLLPHPLVAALPINAIFQLLGRENIQEILSKRLYLCQFITGVSLCRSGDGILAEISEGKSRKNSGGNFLCKLFDVFTPFSVGLLYLLYLSFERISIHKPLTSRPANSERYSYRLYAIFIIFLNNILGF